MEVLSVLGMNPVPIPCSGCGPGFPPLSTGEPAGSIPNTFV